MKFRKDFVTNSSSSSFVCEICGETVSGWDMSYEEAYMFECENGHVCCREHLRYAPREQMIEEILKRDYWDRENEDYFRYTEEDLAKKDDDELIDLLHEHWGEVPEFLCPICSFDEYSEQDMAKYLQKKYGVRREEVFAIIKEKNKRRRKLYDSEYITYVAQKFNVDLSEIPSQWKETFKTYSAFSKYLNE